MYRLSLIIGEIYNKYLPLAEKNSVTLNLDFSDTTKTISNPEVIKANLDQHLKSALDRSDRGEIKIAVESDTIIITDSGTVLSKPICALLSKGQVSVNSRVGFGTTIRISLLPQPEQNTITPPVQNPIKTSSKITETTKPTLAPITKTTKPTKATKSKTTSQTRTPKPSRAKLLRDQRRLAAAAEKADRKIRKIQKISKTKLQGTVKNKAVPLTTQKTTKAKTTAQTKGQAKSTPRTQVKPKSRKTRKRIIEFS